MKRIICTVTLLSTFLFAGCGNDGSKPAPQVPSAADYTKLLEKRKASPDGGDFEIPQEVYKFQNASDEEKIRIFNKVKELVK